MDCVPLYTSIGVDINTDDNDGPTVNEIFRNIDNKTIHSIFDCIAGWVSFGSTNCFPRNKQKKKEFEDEMRLGHNHMRPCPILSSSTYFTLPTYKSSMEMQ